MTGAVNAATIAPGATLLAAGKVMPAPVSTIAGQSFNWSRIVTAGGSHVLSGEV